MAALNADAARGVLPPGPERAIQAVKRAAARKAMPQSRIARTDLDAVMASERAILADEEQSPARREIARTILADLAAEGEIR